MKSLYIFSLNGCIHCQSLKNRLDKLNIQYEDIDIDLNPNIWEVVVKQTNDEVVPTVFIQTNDEGEGLVYVPGRDFEDEDEIVKIIKSNFK